MPTTQEGRLLRLTTPLGDDVLLIKRLRAEEGLSRLFHFTLDVLADHETEMSDEPMVVDVSRLLGQPMTVAVNQNDGTQRFFNGICARFHQGNRKGRYTVYQAVVVPQVWLLTQNIQSRIFQHITVPDILRQVFEGFEVDYEIQGTFEPRNYCVQYRESDFDFASRIMEEEGIFYYFEHKDGSHRMVIANTPPSHREHPTKSRLPFRLNIGNDEGWIPSILNWNVAHQLRTGKVTLWDHNFELPTSHLDAEQLSRFDIGGNRNLEHYDFPGEYAQRFDGVDKTGGDQADKLQKVFEDRRRVAEIRQQEIDVAYRTSTGTSDCCALIGGYRFEMTNHPVSENNCLHVLVSVQTEAVQTPSYISDDSVANPYVVSFSSIPFANEEKKAPFRPLRKTLKPVVHGNQTAFVVGPAGEEIFTDKYGRVKVQFHWDRDGRNDAASSCWLRVATNIAGNKWGMVHIPRIGQEVVVAFMEGDPDQPIIVGSVYNPQSMPHYELPKFKTLSYYKSRTSPDDGKGFNEIRFEDKQGKEQVFIHSQKRMDTRVRGSFYETCGGNRQEVIGVRTDNQPGGNLAITVGGNYDLHVKDSMYIGIDGKLNEAVKGDVVEDYQSNQQTLVKAKAELNAREITLEALTKITFKVGGSFISIDLSGVTVSGPMVKINSGGAGQGTGPATIDDPLDAESADTGAPGYLDRPRTGGGRRGRNRRTLNGQHAPPFATRTLPDGSIQVGNGLVISPSSSDPDFQNKVLEDLTTMSNYPTGMNTLNSLNNSGQTVTIQDQPTGGNSYSPSNVADALPNGQTGNFGGTTGTVTGTGNGSGGTVNYNPDNARNNAIRPRDVGLHHELSHADHAAHGDYDILNSDPSQPNNPHQEESNTIDADNDYRRERGVHTRRDHTTL